VGRVDPQVGSGRVYAVLVLVTFYIEYYIKYVCLQCFDTTGWVAGRASGL